MAETSSSVLSIHLEDARANNVARAVHEVDQLLRRVVAISAVSELDETHVPPMLMSPTERAEYDRAEAARPTLAPRPIRPERGGFLIGEASGGSLDIVGSLYGQVEHLLTSDPVSATTAFFTLLTAGKGVWRFFVKGAEATEAEIAVGDPADIAGLLEQAIQQGRDIDVRAREQSSVWRGRTKEIRIKVRAPKKR